MLSIRNFPRDYSTAAEIEKNCIDPAIYGVSAPQMRQSSVVEESPDVLFSSLIGDQIAISGMGQSDRLPAFRQSKYLFSIDPRTVILKIAIYP